MIGAGDARRDVVVDQIGHPVAVHQAVAGREIAARLPFFRADGTAHGRKIGRVVHCSPVARMKRSVMRDNTIPDFADAPSGISSDLILRSARRARLEGWHMGPWFETRCSAALLTMRKSEERR